LSKDNPFFVYEIVRLTAQSKGILVRSVGQRLKKISSTMTTLPQK
jgi:hypothetical protein